MMVVPTGILDAFVPADNYQTATAVNLTIVGSDVTMQNSEMKPDIMANPQGLPEENSSGGAENSDSSTCCFTGTLRSPDVL